jgi:hypothetical protein
MNADAALDGACAHVDVDDACPDGCGRRVERSMYMWTWATCAHVEVYVDGVPPCSSCTHQASAPHTLPAAWLLVSSKAAVSSRQGFQAAAINAILLWTFVPVRQVFYPVSCLLAKDLETNYQGVAAIAQTAAA